jgi:hypothetical protein
VLIPSLFPFIFTHGVEKINSQNANEHSLASTAFRLFRRVVGGGHQKLQWRLSRNA